MALLRWIWRRRWARRLLIAAVVLAGLRLALTPLAELVVRTLAARAGYELGLDLSLSLLALDASAEQLVLAPREGTGPVRLQARRVAVDLAPRALLGGRLVVNRLEVEGVRAELTLPPPGAPAAAEREGRAPPSPWPPEWLRVEQLLLRDVRLRVRGAAAALPPETEVVLQAHGAGLGADGRAATLALELAVPGVCESVEAELVLELAAAERRARAELSLSAEGIAHRALQGLLAPQLRLLGEQSEFVLRASAQLAPAGEGSPEAYRLAWTLSGLRWSSPGATWLELPAASGSAVLAPGRLEAGPTRLQGLTTRLSREPGGELRLGALRLLPASAAAASPEEPRGARPPARAAASLRPPPPSVLPALSCEQLTLERARLELIDRAVSPPFATQLAVHALRARGLAWPPAPRPAAPAAPGGGAGAGGEQPQVVRRDGTPPVAPLEIEATAALEPLLGQLRLRVHGERLGLPAHYSIALEAAGVDLEPVRPYLPPDWQPAMRRGRLLAEAQLELAAAAGESVAATLRVGPLWWSDAAGSRLAGLEALELVAPRVLAGPAAVEIETVRLEAPYLHLRRLQGGWLELAGALVLPPPAPLPPPPPPPSEPLRPEEPAAGGAQVPAPQRPQPAPGGAPPLVPLPHGPQLPLLTVERFELERVGLVLEDAGHAPPRQTALQLGTIAIEGLSTAALRGEPREPVRLRARFAAPGLVRLLELEGFAALGQALTGQLQGRVLRLDLAELLRVAGGAGSGEAGASEGLRLEGLADVQLRARLEPSRLEAEARLRIEGLRIALGELWSGRITAWLGMPLGLLLAVLEDEQGAIRLELPLTVEAGRLSLPIPQLLAEQLVASVRNTAAKLFQPLGRLVFGRGARALAFRPIAFVPGTVRLSPEGYDQVVRLAEFLREREALRVELSGVAHPELDAAALLPGTPTVVSPGEGPVAAGTRAADGRAALAEALERLRRRRAAVLLATPRARIDRVVLAAGGTALDGYYVRHDEHELVLYVPARRRQVRVRHDQIGWLYLRTPQGEAAAMLEPLRTQIRKQVHVLRALSLQIEQAERRLGHSPGAPEDLARLREQALLELARQRAAYVREQLIHRRVAAERVLLGPPLLDTGEAPPCRVEIFAAP
ncbi:MAG: hypothetical protein KatS3mg102_0459 [Planctomycetota bacterium]|nr:MAG: hypothetical protein KatS3mg102_0459 [Planctomycetota bacterium]